MHRLALSMEERGNAAPVFLVIVGVIHNLRCRVDDDVLTLDFMLMTRRDINF
jgi:hypothetical protein